MRPTFEVACVFRRHGDAYRHARGDRMGRVERRVMRAVELCRTAALGGHVEACEACGFARPAYNSCRNRHCPKCQGQAARAWIERRCADLLPVPYFHVVFTMPAAVADIAFHNKPVVYGILFEAAALALRKLAADPKRLGAEIGLTAVLHTWGQNLLHHPHVHCVVPGGGLSLDGSAWRACKRRFFLPVKPLARLYRRLFLDRLAAAFAEGRLVLAGALAPLSEGEAFDEALSRWRRLDWIVYVKPPFGGPERVLAYLGRYTHRVAISNSRIVAIDERSVSFTWRDYRTRGQIKVMRLDAHEFIRRFLAHALPDGFHRIRHYGFLANARRTEKLTLIRRLLAVAAPAAPPPSSEAEDAHAERKTDRALHVCPCCGGRMEIVQAASAPLPTPRAWDTS